MFRNSKGEALMRTASRALIRKIALRANRGRTLWLQERVRRAGPGPVVDAIRQMPRGQGHV